mgnify:CR=1 FL=1
MAVTRVFPKRQEDPLIQQLLQKARQEAAQSSAIGSPSMYTAAAGGGIGPVAGVLTAQVLGGIRSRNALQAAQLKQEQANIADTKLTQALINRQVDGKLVGADGRFYETTSSESIPIEEVNLADALKQTKSLAGDFIGPITSRTEFVKNEDGELVSKAVPITLDQIPEEERFLYTGTRDKYDATTVDIPGTPKADNILAKIGNIITGKQNVKDIKAANLFELAAAARIPPEQMFAYLQAEEQKTAKTTFSKPEQSGLLTTDDKGDEKLQEVTLRTKTITEDGIAKQIIEIRKPGEDGNFRPIRSNETITGVAGSGDDIETFKSEYIVSSENPKNSVGKITQTKKIVNGEIEFLITPTSGPLTGTTISNIHNADEFTKFLEGNKIITTQQLSAELGETSIKRYNLVKDVRNIRETELGIRKLDDYIVALDKSPQGVDRFALKMKAFVKQLATNNNLTEGEVMLQLANGKLQGLLGSSRLEVLGGGVMTEYDAQRVIQYLGGDVDSFQSIQKVKMAMQKLLEEKKSRYNIDLESYNLDRAGLGQKGQLRFKPIESIFPTLKSNEILAPTQYPRLTEYEIKNMDKTSEVLNTINEVIEQVLSNKPANYQLQDEDLLEYFNAKQIRDIKKRFKELGI